MADYDPRLMRELREDDVDPFGGELIGLGEPDYRTTDPVTLYRNRSLQQAAAGGRLPSWIKGSVEDVIGPAYAAAEKPWENPDTTQAFLDAALWERMLFRQLREACLRRILTGSHIPPV